MSIDKVRCWECQGMFEPWTNERHCSDKCHDAAQRAITKAVAADEDDWRQTQEDVAGIEEQRTQ